jgi:hypothetical protein
MSDDDSGGSATGFDYAQLMRSALLGVVREVLARTAADGLPGDHHLYLTFGTADEGVELPARLRKQFPDEMTIVLQHQFWGLAPNENGFTVALRFGGARERLFVPWPALRAFADPSVGFGFRLVAPVEAPEAAAAEITATGLAATEPAKVVDLGAFRRRAGEPETQSEE